MDYLLNSVEGIRNITSVCLTILCLLAVMFADKWK